MGGTANELASRMSEREFHQWARYAAQRVMPLHRIEIYLAQIAWVVARAMGSNDSVQLSDFMIDFGSESDSDSEPSFDEAAQAFAFNPRPKKVNDGIGN